MGKFVLPPVKKILGTKIIYDKHDPIWVILEKEMQENIPNKPYNDKVGNWLKFLKDLRYHYFCEAKQQERALESGVGPRWYTEFSIQQREVLSRIKMDIHQDLLEDVPRRMRQDLSDLGVTLKIPKSVLMNAMEESIQDPGLFFWKLYEAIYKKSPSELLPSLLIQCHVVDGGLHCQKYDMNARILMSCLVFIDIDECVETLEHVTYHEKPKPVVPAPKKNKYFQPKVKFGEYLQKMHVPFYSSHKPKKKIQPLPLGNKLKIRSEESYEKLCVDKNFLVKRQDRNKHAKEKERVCKYKFWEPPASLHTSDPKKIAYLEKMRMLKLKPARRFAAPYENVQFLIGGISYSGGMPRYQLGNIAVMPTGYIAINDGIAVCNGVNVTCIDGYWKYPVDVIEKCDSECDCTTKWEPSVMEFLKTSKCKCGHLYDFYNEELRNKEKYFYPPTTHGPLWIDHAKIFQMDPMEDFIKDTFAVAIKSTETTPVPSEPTLNASGLKKKELLAALLANLSDTPLLIPHLPQANMLNNLQEWARARVRGKLEPKSHKQMMLLSQRRWLNLKHMDFRARAFRIPFTSKQLKNITWEHRKIIQKLFLILLENFCSRNRQNQVEQTRLWWPTTKYDNYPNKQFLDTFFTYMPGRNKDSYWVNPYRSDNIKHGAKTCPLNN